jgi:hypothetical protein
LPASSCWTYGAFVPETQLALYLRRVSVGYNNRMDTTEIIETIDAEIARLERARVLLNGHTTPAKRGRPVNSAATPTKPPRRKISAEGRARIAAAQRARWAKAKKA